MPGIQDPTVREAINRAFDTARGALLEVQRQQSQVHLGRVLTDQEKAQVFASKYELVAPQPGLHSALQSIGSVGGPLNPYGVAARALGRLMEPPAAPHEDKRLTEAEWKALQSEQFRRRVKLIAIVGEGALTGASVGSAVGTMVAGPPGLVGGAIAGALVGGTGAFLLVMDEW